MIIRYALRWFRKNLAKKQHIGLYKQLQNIANEGLGHGNDEIIAQAESNLIERLKRKMPSRPIVFDIGANVGDYLDHWMGRQAQLYAFEPGEEAFEQLMKRFEKNATVINMAVGASSERRDFFIEKGDNRLNSLLPRVHSQHNWVNKGKVECITLDSFCVKQGVERIDFLKIDVEGSELEVLKGASEILKQTHMIQFEFGGAHMENGVYFRDFYNLLSPNFTLHHILLDGIESITAYHEKLENFTGANFLAIRLAH